MKVYLKDEYVGDWPHGRTPTLPEMFRVKIAMPEFKNPLRFMQAAIEIIREVPVIDPETKKQKVVEVTDPETGEVTKEPVVEHVPNELYDPQATAMWLSLVYKRAGQDVRFETIDAGFEDLRLELTEDEQAEADAALGKAPTPSSSSTSTETPSSSSSSTPSDCGSSTD